ncbi:DUF4126 family protein [Microbacterium sp. MC2]
MTLRAAALGLAGGMRSMAPAAMLALSHGDTSSAAAWTRWPVLRSRWGRRVLVLFGAGELIGDKLPGIPSRLELPALIGRVAIVTVSAAALGSEYGGKGRIIWAAIVGAVSALAGNILFGGARTEVTTQTAVPDRVVAVAEDAACIGLLAAVARTRPA